MKPCNLATHVYLFIHNTFQWWNNDRTCTKTRQEIQSVSPPPFSMFCRTIPPARQVKFTKAKIFILPSERLISVGKCVYVYDMLYSRQLIPFAVKPVRCLHSTPCTWTAYSGPGIMCSSNFNFRAVTDWNYVVCLQIHCV